MAITTLAIKDGAGNAQTLAISNFSGTTSLSLVQLSDGTNVCPSMDAVGRAAYMFVTDGTHTFPTADVAARKLFGAVTDGTNTATCKAASTAAASGDTSLVVALHPSSAVTTNGDGTVAGGAVASKSLLAGLQYLAWASLPAITTAGQASIMSDSSGNQKVCVVPPGTPLYASATASATTSAGITHTIPATGMGYLHGFDVDGLGATAGAISALTITGLKGTTLTFDIGFPTGVTVPMTVSKRFSPPLQCSTTALNIVLTCPGPGAGNTGFSLASYASWI